MNDGGGGPTHYVTAGQRPVGGGCQNAEVQHANEFQFPGGTIITDVCVAWRFPDGLAGGTAYLFFADPDPNNANLPGNVSHEEPFPINVNGGHQILHLQAPQGVFGQTWVGVRYPDARCYLPHQGIAQRVQGRAAVRVVGAGAWRDYDDPQVLINGGAHYGGRVPIIRPLTLGPNTTGPAGVFVNTGGVNPLVTDECGRSALFSVALTRAPAPGRSVLVIMSVSNPLEAEINLALPTLIFNGANWSIPQLVEVIGKDDPFFDGDQPYTIDFIVSSLDPAYAGLSVPSIPAVNEDNDDMLVVCPQAPIQWRPVTTATTPPERYFSDMVYDSARGVLVMFGGTDAGANPQGDTWESNGLDWRLVASFGPAPRERHAMAYDSLRRVTVLYGGYDPRLGVAYEDTWEWDGVAWLMRSPGLPNAPGGPRGGHEMVYDPFGGRTILYGGEFTADTNTWFWDGNTWFMPTYPRNPGLRWGHAMSFDPLRRRAYLYGGQVAGGAGETWQLDPNNDWSPAGFPGFSPGDVAYPEMAYDSARDVHVLFGGYGNGGFFLNHTWTWNADRENWTLVQSLLSPPARSEFGMDFDAARGEVVLFGGAEPGAPPGAVGNDTWAFPVLLPYSPITRTYCITGVATGAPWHWAIRALGLEYVVDDPMTPGVAAGSTAEVITQHFVDRINSVCCTTLRASVVPSSPTCFEIEVDSVVPFNLFVGPVGAPECLVTQATSCSFNPDILEVALSGRDCDGNLIDDAIDIAVDPTLDANGNGVLDSCEPGGLTGDMNCDGVISVSDIGGFVLALTNPAGYAAQFPNCSLLHADTNGDGMVSVGDIGPFVRLLTGP